MRNFLSFILIVAVIAGVFYIFQKTYTPVEHSTNTEQTNPDKQNDPVVADQEKIDEMPSNILFTEEAPFYTVEEPTEGNGSAYLKHNSIDVYELNIAVDLPQPEDEVYVAWLTGGISPDSYVYLGKLRPQNYMGYGLIYKTSEIYEQFLAFHTVVISLEEKIDEMPSSPSNILLQADFR